MRPGLRANLETAVIKSWANDPWQQGACAMYNPGEVRWYADVCRAEWRVWFAREHASNWPGWMPGAPTSGIRATPEINVT